MSDIKDIMKIKPETLAWEQYTALKNYAVERINLVSKLVETGDFDKVRLMLEDSPAGDECGTDSQFVKFNYGEGTMHLGEIVDKLESLNKLSSEVSKNEKV